MHTLDFNKMMENAGKLNNYSKKTEKKVDERFYEVIRDQKTGNTQSVIRFLANEDDDTFFIKIFTHYFDEGGRIYSSICPSTIGEKCPVCDHNKAHWNEYDETQKEARKRKYKYVSNILVVKDPEHQDREGKTFLFKYGTQIHQKIMSLINPTKDDLDDDGNPKTPYNIFDFNTGKNFKMKVKTVKKYANYVDSEFSANPTPIFEGDEKKQEELKKSIYLLKDQLPKKETMKSYEDLEKRLIQVVNGEPISKSKSDEGEGVWEEETKELPVNTGTKSASAKVVVTEPLKETVKTKTVEKEDVPVSDEEDFFKF